MYQEGTFEGMLCGVQGPGFRVLGSAGWGALEVSRVLVTLSVCALLGGAGALMLPHSTTLVKKGTFFTSYYCTALCLRYTVNKLPPSLFLGSSV